MDFAHKFSPLKLEPKSCVIKEGYINIYSELTSQEKRQIHFKTKFHERNPFWDETLVYLAKSFQEEKGAGLIALDLGCGHGNYVIDENRQKIDWAVGFDVSSDQTARNISLDEFYYGNAGDLPFQDGTFDSVISLWVFEHLQDPGKVFRQVARVLRPGGRFLFAAPNKNFLPLKFVHLLKGTKIPQFLNKFLFGREEKDVFPAYYKANTIKDIRKNIPKSLKTIELRYNFDPSYASFCDFSYRVTVLAQNMADKLNLNFLSPHIIGIFEKQPE